MMDNKKFRFRIDEKSLFYGIVNDYERGQTATVSTPINQSSDPNKWHRDIMELYPYSLNVNKLPYTLLDKCTSKTTSQAESEISYFFKFDKILFDGNPLNCNYSFALYVKKEISEMIRMKTTGRMGINTHYGRLKLHYPITLKYVQDKFNIDNKAVLDAITQQNGGFAIVVRGFEVNTKDMSLNFLTSMIGVKDVVKLSNAFIRKKGVGKKLLLDEIDYDEKPLDVSAEQYEQLRKVKTSVGDSDYFENLNRIRSNNGKVGEQYIIEHFRELICDKAEDIYHTSLDYPTSPYDIEYTVDGVKKYLEVKSSSGSRKTFNMSSGEIKFMDKYDSNYTLVLVTNVLSQFPDIDKYKRSNIMKMKKSYPKVVFTAA